MKKREFEERLSGESTHIDLDWIHDVLDKSIFKEIPADSPTNGHMDLIIVMEELAELTKELSKYLRGKGDHYHIVEELSDVCACIWYVQNICGISDEELSQGINVKFKRLEQRNSIRDEGM